MKFTANAAAIATALGRVQRIVEKRNTIPILSNVLMSIEGDTLTIVATDLDIRVSDTVSVEAAKPGGTTIPAHIFHDMLRKLPPEADVSVEVDGAVAAIKCGRSRFKLNVLPAEDFPDLSPMTEATTLTMKATELLDLFDDVAFAMSTEETRYYLNGIYLHHVMLGNRPVMRMVATDGHRLAQSQIDSPTGGDVFPNVIVPRKTTSEMARLLTGAKPDETVDVRISNMKIAFQYGTTSLVSKLIDGTFPDYTRVIPQNNEKKLIVDCATFKTAVDRVGTVSTERGRAVKMTLSDNQATFSVTSQDHGSASDEIVAEYGDEAFDIGFNAKYLLDMAAQLKGEKVHFLLADAGSPTIILGNGSDDRLYVLMPMRV